jgi:arginase family enzyme
VLDPTERWRGYHGHDWKASWAGLLTFAELPYTEDPAELEKVDVAVVGAPTDELNTHSPGARFGPRAIRAADPTAAHHLEARIDWSESLRGVDYGDAPVVPLDADASHRAIKDTVEVVAGAGVIPIVLGGGMTPSELLSACRAVAARLRLVGADVVEVAPTGLADRTALVADRVVREMLTGIALRRVIPR